MQDVNVQATARDTGSKAARRIRKTGQVPCVLYSRNTEATPFQMEALQLKRIAFSREMQRININLDGGADDEARACILKDYDLHPVTDEPTHADFQVLEAGEEITLTVPIRYVGTPFGQTEGGDTQYILGQIEIACQPQDIPEHVEVNVEALDIGDSLHVSDLDVEGVVFRTPPQQTLVTVLAPFVEPTEEEETTVLEEGELAEEGELVDTEEGEAPDAEVGEDEEGDFEEDL